MAAQMPWLQDSHPATAALENHLKTAPYGKEFTYADLSEIVGFDITKKRFVLNTVNRRLINHHERCLVNVRGQGYKIADPVGMMAEAATHRHKARKALKRGYIITEAVPLDHLTDTQKTQLFTEKAKEQALLVCFKAVDKKELIDKNGKQCLIGSPTDSEIVELLRRKSIERGEMK